MSRALEKVTEDLLIKNIDQQSYEYDLYFKISRHLNNSMDKYQHISFKDTKHAYSKLIKEDIAFIKTTQGHIMSSKPYTSSRGNYHYPHRILELLLNI